MYPARWSGRRNWAVRVFAIGLLATFIAGRPTPCAGQEKAAATTATRPGEAEKLSDAERIARLQRVIKEGTQRLKSLKGQRDDPKDEFAEAESAFKELDAQYAAEKEQVRSTEPTSTSQPTRETQDALEKKWKLAKDRFDLAIQERKMLQEQILALEQKLNQDTDAIQKLLGSPTSQPGESVSTAPPAAPAATSRPASVQPTGTPLGESSSSPLPLSPLGVVEKALQGTKSGGGQSPATPMLIPKPPSKELIQASEEAIAKQVEAGKARSEAQSITERMEGLRKAIDLERRQFETAQKQADNAAETARSLREELQLKWSGGAPQGQLEDYWKKIADAEQRAREARGDMAKRSRHLDALQAELNDVQADQIAAMREAEKKSKVAAEAQEKVKELNNPLAPRNLWRWIVESGPKVLAVLLGMAGLLYLARVLRGRLVVILSHTGDRGTAVERENRAKTLVSVFSNAASMAIIVGGSFMIFTELGVNIVPLMGGAAVIGLAVAFGAQNLIRDYFYGFMILFENQYGINDVVTICGVSGQVERITLRITVLRDLEGVVHFIPNGQITTVSNKTHGWSRAVIEIGVAYKEDVDRVMQVVMELAKELRHDPAFADGVMEDPEMLGVTRLGDSSVMIKFVMKTRPGKHWSVQREILRRIKNRFGELGIEIPNPRQTVFHQYEGGGPRVVP